MLTVRTDQGDFILDNKRREVLLWADTPYTYVKRQSEKNPLVWISLLPPDIRAANRGVSLEQPLAGVFDTPVRLGHF